MKTILFTAVLLFGFTIFFASNSYAQTQQISEVTVVNKTGMNVNDLYFSIVGANNWGFDVVPKDDFKDGETLKFKFSVVDKDHCNWDIQYVTSDGKSATLKNINLCEQTVVLEQK